MTVQFPRSAPSLLCANSNLHSTPDPNPIPSPILNLTLTLCLSLTIPLPLYQSPYGSDYPPARTSSYRSMHESSPHPSQDAWLEEQFTRKTCGATHVIVLSHVPPFVGKEEEVSIHPTRPFEPPIPTLHLPVLIPSNLPVPSGARLVELGSGCQGESDSDGGEGGGALVAGGALPRQRHHQIAWRD